MSNSENIFLAAKCAPNKEILSSIRRAGLKAVEIYLSEKILESVDSIIELCSEYEFRYALHSPTDGIEPFKLAKLARAIKAEVVVFHDIYWEREWENIVEVFDKSQIKLCVENINSVKEPIKFIRRFGMGRCLDLEHLQIECAGVFEEEFLNVMRQASHVHLTGYIYRSNLWHTHIHHSPEHNFYMLDLLDRAEYSGMIVSEAKASLQTYEEFCKLNVYYDLWKAKRKL